MVDKIRNDGIDCFNNDVKGNRTMIRSTERDPVVVSSLLRTGSCQILEEDHVGVHMEI